MRPMRPVKPGSVRVNLIRVSCRLGRFESTHLRHAARHDDDVEKGIVPLGGGGGGGGVGEGEGAGGDWWGVDARGARDGDDG